MGGKERERYSREQAEISLDYFGGSSEMGSPKVLFVCVCVCMYLSEGELESAKKSRSRGQREKVPFFCTYSDTRVTSSELLLLCSRFYQFCLPTSLAHPIGSHFCYKVRKSKSIFFFSKSLPTKQLITLELSALMTETEVTWTERKRKEKAVWKERRARSMIIAFAEKFSSTTISMYTVYTNPNPNQLSKKKKPPQDWGDSEEACCRKPPIFHLATSRMKVAGW